jgi:hypothetical protein
MYVFNGKKAKIVTAKCKKCHAIFQSTKNAYAIYLRTRFLIKIIFNYLGY